MKKSKASLNISNNNLKDSMESKFADMNLDLSKINKKFGQYETYQEHIEELLREEAKLRQNIEKKTFLMNENTTTEIQKLKKEFNEFNNTMLKHIDNIKNEIIIDITNNNNKYLNSFETNLKKFDEIERNYLNRKNDYYLQINECENKIKTLEEILSNQLNVIKNEINSNKNSINSLTNNVNSNLTSIQNEINNINSEINFMKNDFEKLKSQKLDNNKLLNKLKNDFEMLNDKQLKVKNDFNLFTSDIINKLNHYENISKMIENNYNSTKNELQNKIQDFLQSQSKQNSTIKNDFLNEIKKCKIEIEKFNLNIINENQKFIDFNQNNLQTQNENVKKLFEYTNDDIETLKKKCETLEIVIKNIRNEMIGNINNLEGYLTKRYDEVFRTMASERTNFNY